MLKLNIFYVVKQNNAFNMKTVFMNTVDRKLGSSQCNQWGPWFGRNGQLAVCASKLLVFIQYNISVQCKQKQPGAFRLLASLVSALECVYSFSAI